MRSRTSGLLLVALLTTGAAASRAADAPVDSTLLDLRAEARALAPLATTALARGFLSAVDRLPAPAPAVLFCDSSRAHYWTEGEAKTLADSTRARLIRRELDGHFFYATRYGTPLAYVRALELLGQAGLASVDGRRILDFGYGTIGHLRLLALMGANAFGVDVDPMLRALYAGAQGALGAGSVRLLDGRFPADPAVAEAAGGDYDLILSKNTLKRGYVHPERPVDPRLTVQLGVADSVFVRETFKRLRPGGWFMIYNLCPAPSPPDKPYKPWADGRCPFPEPMLVAAGFEVAAYDRDDSETARRMGHALGWDQGPSPMDLANDLFGTYTLARKPGPRTP